MSAFIFYIFDWIYYNLTLFYNELGLSYEGNSEYITVKDGDKHEHYLKSEINQRVKGYPDGKWETLYGKQNQHYLKKIINTAK